MDLSDLLDWGLKSEEPSKEFEALRGWVESAVILARAQLAAGSDRQPLAHHFAQLPSEEALRLSSALSSSASPEIYNRIEALRREQNSPDADPTEIYSGLSALLSQVDRSARGQRRWSIGLKLLKIAAYAGPLVLAYLVGTYFRFYNNLYWDSDSMLSPPATYSQRSGNYGIDEEYQTRFFREFSRYYFDRKNAFVEEFLRGRLAMPIMFGAASSDTSKAAGTPASKFLDSPDKSQVSANLGALRLRLVFKNPRRADPLLVSSIETTSTYHKKPFDWSRVEVSTDLDVQVSADTVFFSDKGIGPAENVKYTVSAANLSLYTSSYDYLLNRTVQEQLTSANGDVVSLQINPPGSGKLAQPVYHLFHSPAEDQTPPKIPPSNPFTIKGTLLTCADGRQYELVKDAGRLSQLTTTVQGGPARVDLTFESLRGERASKSVAATLPTGYVFVKLTDQLSVANPCLPPSPKVLAARGPGPAAVARFIDTVSGGQSSLKGVDLITAASVIDLLHLPDGGRVGVVASPNEILNPGGFAILDLTLGNAGNGALDLQFRVNGSKLRETTVQLLVPDDANFEPVTPAKLRHFRPEKE